MDINYELYKVFYYVAKTLSFSEAASSLFISQSAVSQSIKVLEKRLNQTLFIRSTKKVALTKEGELLFKHIEPAINLINRGENQLLEAIALGESQLRLGASDTICRYYLVPFLDEFHKKYPDVHIKVTNGTSLQCAKMLENNEVDIIVTNSPNSALVNSMHIDPIYEFQDVFIGNPEFFKIGKEPLTFDELQKHPILMLTKQSTTSEFLHNLFIQHSLELVPAVELSSNDLLIDLAKIGLGLAFIPDFCLKDEDIKLVKVPITEELPIRKLVVAYNENIPLSSVTQYFIELLGK
ncbi:LysR family transcriptional regulator [Anaerocolumna aminovalerica]|jgi:DNA-binding transcriptional LysR family regulator|uniref:DNA-binding transcriptional regulator, LysR family n=1 Tax=Anaerocolumna aminovalerica TaxID=1527 RepID=A0A1I5EQZ1_9FIRM|nr:LysR family transcriptional regulator [Anaerocolumna aminovalerica]MBU5331646.1 LysR family transcriptional regulator [Anaerocolumna aminovalerica]MDU6266202.1 LysR family transcriptional regulator [Anaerocolumna aminovalerica]SFO13932.1 DNA-binding transcriptional regulator, LysR family [Anaerocolumna aminovalerica]